MLEAIDDENNSITYKIIEGDLLEHYKSFKGTIKSIPKDGKTSIIHWTLEYEKLHGEIVDPHTLVDFAIDVSKSLEKHLSEA